MAFLCIWRNNDLISKLYQLTYLVTAPSYMNLLCYGATSLSHILLHHQGITTTSIKMTAALLAAVLSHKLAPFSIKVYISAISLLHCREGLQSPTTHSTWDSKTTQPTWKTRLYTAGNAQPPATLPQVEKARLWHAQYSNKLYMVSCMRAIHNFVTPFLQPMSVTTRPHTQYLTSSEAVTFTIIRSKTDQTAHGHTITLHATGGSYAQSELSLL